MSYASDRLPALETLRVEIAGAVGRIELHRPEKRNAINAKMAEELSAILPILEADPDVRVLLLKGAGKNFCSGGDLAPEGSGASEPRGSAASTRYRRWRCRAFKIRSCACWSTRSVHANSA